MIHAPAVRQQAFHRAVDHLRRQRLQRLRLAGARTNESREIDPVERQEHVCLGEQLAFLVGRLVADRRQRMQGMIDREGRRAVGGTQHGRPVGFRKFDPVFPCVEAARHAARENNRALCVRQHRVNDFKHVFHDGGWLRRLIAFDRRQRHLAVERRFLHAGVEAHINWPVRIGSGDRIGSQDGFDSGFGRRRLVVPFDEVADHRRLILRRMNPLDPRPADVGVHRSGRAEDHHRAPVAPGVEDRHRAVHQPDIRMQDDEQRLFGDA